MGKDRPGRKPNPANTIDISKGTPGVDFELIIVRTEEEEEALGIYNTGDDSNAAKGVRVIDPSTRLRKDSPDGASIF